jgi:acetone carboxylase gamma subunit
LIYVRDNAEAMHEVYPALMAPDTNWQVYREYYCPSCGTMHDVEAPTPWYPVMHEFEPDIEAFYNDWVHLPLPEKAN